MRKSTGMRRCLAAAITVTLGVCALPVHGVVLDRIAATVGDEAITTSQIEQYETLRLILREPGEDELDYERRILTTIVERILQYRDVRRFGLTEVTTEQVDEALGELIERFSSREQFESALETSGMSLEELRMVLLRELEVDSFIQLRFSPMVFVSLEEIETYYRDVWVEERLRTERALQPLAAVRDEIRAILKASRLEDEIERWTEELRDRVNIDIFI